MGPPGESFTTSYFCNAGNSDKKYGGTHEDASVTVQGNKAKLWDSRPLAVKVTAKYYISINNGIFH